MTPPLTDKETDLTNTPEDLTDLEVRQAIMLLYKRENLRFVRTEGDPEAREP